MTGLDFPDNLMGIFGFKRVEEDVKKKCKHWQDKPIKFIAGIPKHCDHDLLNKPCPKNTDDDCNIIARKRKKV